MAHSKQIAIEINGTEFDAVVEFSFFPGEEGCYHLQPGDCHPSEPDSYEINSLFVYSDGVKMNKSLLISYLEDQIVEKLEELRNMDDYL
jgi:hypothetical protein